jgi:hypothetical protein
MAVLAAILPVVSRSSCLALELYQFAASSPGSAKDFVKVARAINNFALILKQVGTIIKEDDRLPSLEVCHCLHVRYANIIIDILCTSDCVNVVHKTRPSGIPFPKAR